MPSRKRGAPIGNQNAVTHGRFSKPTRERRQTEAEERRRKEAEWAAKMPQTDYGKICDELRRLKLAGVTGGQSRARH